MDCWATAKVNLFLKVVGRRPDGYHTIETVYQSVALADCLRFEVTAGDIVLTCDDPGLPDTGNNLVVRAAELMRQRFPDKVRGLRVTLEKRVPIGSGLGGGSADAAATLKACNKLFRLHLGSEQLRELAAGLGMDVPFLIEGGRAIGRERGERLEPLPVSGSGWAVIVVPRIAISTRWAYEQLDEVRPRETLPLELFVERLQNEPLRTWAGLCYNAFEDVVFQAHPELETLKNRLRNLGCAGAVMSGSGAAIVGLTEDQECAREVAQNLSGPFQVVEAVAFCPSAMP